MTYPSFGQMLDRVRQVLGRPLGIVTVALLAVTVLPVYRNGPPIRSDGLGYHIWTRALLEGDLSFRRYADVQGIHAVDRARGLFQNQYPPGVALLRLPVMALLVHRDQAGPLVCRAEHRASLVLSALALLGALFLAQQTCRLLNLDQAAAGWALLTLTFGTGLFHYATFDGCFSHVYSALLVSALVWLGVRACVLDRPHLPLAPVSGLCLLLLLIRNTNLLLLGCLAVAYLVLRWRRGEWTRGTWLDLAALLGGAGAAAALQLAYNYQAHGGWAFSSYGPDEQFLWDRPMLGSVLFSYRRGLFSYYPVLAPVLVSALLVRRTRVWAAGFGLLLLSYAVLYGYWYSWWLGGGFGHRGFVELMPLALVLFAAALSSLRARLRGAALGTACLCSVLTLQLMVGYWQGSLPCDGITGPRYWEFICGGHSLLGAVLQVALAHF